MTISDLRAAVAQAKAHRLETFVLCARRISPGGKALKCPKRIYLSLKVECIGGDRWNWFVTLKVAEAERFLVKSGPADQLPMLRVHTPEEKMGNNKENPWP